MTDYKKVAETLRAESVYHGGQHEMALAAAIALCERTAAGELVAREEGQHAGSPAPTQDKSEREHCEQVAWRYIEQASCEAEDKELSTHYADLLMRERAAARAEKEAQCDAHMEAFRVLKRNYDAADQAGYERGRAEQSEHTASALELGDKAGYERGFAEGRKARENILRAHVEQQDKIEDMATQVREYRDRCDADISALQAKYDRLAAAARNARKMLDKGMTDGARNALDAALEDIIK